MPYTLKKGKFKYRNPETGNYQGVDVVAERSFSEYRSELESVGLLQQNLVVEAAHDALTDQRITQAVDNWLDSHPESIPPVEAHSITVDRLVDGTLNYYTPQMYGAVGDGSTDDTTALLNTFNIFIILFFILLLPYTFILLKV